MSSDEECDYMSEKFVSGGASQDIRPGLLFKQSQKRSCEILKRQAQTNEQNRKRFRPIKQVEEERRQEGLSQAIDSSNKGFAMLQKMGYKPGSAIGKTGEGRLDPIRVDVKADRHGLGREAALREVAIRKAHLRAQALKRREQFSNVESYRSRLVERETARLVKSDLSKSQRVCQQLDTQKNVEAPSEIWFWPPVQKKSKRAKEIERRQKCNEDAEEEEEEEKDAEEDKEEKEEDSKEEDLENGEDVIEFETQEKLEMLTLYLRKAHLYCLWCGTKYEGDSDISENCPGSTRDDH